MSNNDEAGGSRVPVDPEEHHPYFSMLAGEHFDADQHDEDGDAGNETTTSGAGDGNETTTSGAGDGNVTSGSEAKRQRKERGPNKLRTIREEFTEVDPASGLPTLPVHVAKGYGNSIGCILRELVNLNEEDLRSKSNEPLATLLIQRLHARYKFPEPYDNLDIKKNLANTFALGKFSKALSTWKGYVRQELDAGSDFDKIKGHWPSISEEDFNVFKAKHDLPATKALRKWGKDMHKKNVAPHNLGSRGYPGKQPVWDKEDAERKGPDPYPKFKNPLGNRFVRARYRVNPKTKELVTNAKVKDLENKIREEESLAQSQGSSTQVPFDNSFERALNRVKDLPVSALPHRGRVVGAGLSHKHSFYYPETKEARKERKKNEEKNVREELETVKAEMPNIISAQVTQTVNDLLPTMMKSIAEWIDGGRQGPLPVITLGASGSNNELPIVENTTATGNTPQGVRDESPAGTTPRSSPSISYTPAAVRGASSLDELNALTVNKRRKSLD